MNIIWKPNPLATVIELDDFDKKLFWHRIKIENLQGRIFSAYFDLNSKDREWHNRVIGERSLEAAVESALRRLDADYIIGEKKDSRGESFDQRIDDDLKDYLAALSEKHDGDCTCVPCSCLKCHAESLLGIDTIPGLPKHSAYKIDAAFGKPEEGRTIDQAIEYLRDYHPVKGAGWENATEEQFQAHVPRWVAEAKTAHDWLVAYKQEHFNA